uniref:Ig-like domain-containing protein n=1 Tax=Neogobius melanostomus TaxID=47308 RepID=A0A8C6TI60_9GOBI
MKTLLAALVIALVHCGSATLVIKGPTSPVLEGESVTVECLLQDSEYNISDVRFEYFNKFKKAWTGVRERFSWCGFGRLPIERTEDRITLTIPYAASYYDGFRCVTEGINGTAPDHMSEPLNFMVHYLRGPQLSRDGYSRYYGFPQVLSVRAGADVTVNCSATSSEEPSISWYKEGSDWILPSSVLTLEKVSTMDEGQYTCSVQHPTIPSLSKTHSFNITVLSEQASWYQTSDGLIVLTTVVAMMSCLLVMILAVSVFLCRRAKKIRTSKGPIDDHSQKKPIYKSSTESVPITCGDDKQPLV